METFILQAISAHQYWTYAFVFLGMLLEGETILFAAIFLAHQGTLKLAELMPIAIVGVAAGDLLWIYLGRHLSRRRHQLIHWIMKASQPVADILEKRPGLALLISKFAYGLNRATLLRVGMSSVSWRRLWLPALLAGWAWLLVIGGLSYIFSASFSILRNDLTYAEVGLIAAIILFFAIQKFVARTISRDRK